MNAFSYAIGFLILVSIVGAGYFYTTKQSEAPSKDYSSDEPKTYGDETETKVTDTTSTTEIPKETPKSTTGSKTETPASTGGTNTGGTGSTNTGTAGNIPTPTPTPTPKTVTINYSSAGFTPANVEIKVGDTVKWVSSSASMWVASANHPSHTIYPEFDQLSTGNSYQFTFTKVGSWNYHNHVSANHTGTVVVK